jgi:Spy/CpxP family protein refolding chaperone
MMHRCMTIVFFLILPLAVMAQPMGEPPMGPGLPGMSPPAFIENIFPPSLIMRHETEIGLTDAQRDAITKQMEDAQKSLVSSQWDVERESQKLSKLLEPPHIDDAAALTQVDRLMKAEEKLKKAHLTLLIQIKNILTPAQQEKLRQLRPVHGRF